MHNRFQKWLQNRSKNIKSFRRWPRLLLSLTYLLIIFGLLLIIREEYVLQNATPVSSNDQGGIVFGISLVAEPPQTLLSNLKAEEKEIDWSSSFLLQSQSPTVQVFLDYIAIHDNVSNPQYCFTSFNLGKDINVPFQFITEVERNSRTDSETEVNFGELANKNVRSSMYVYQLTDRLCLDQGGKYFLPHVFLGIISSYTYADLGMDVVKGYSALGFFPFDQQEITLDLTTNHVVGNSNYNVRPNLDVSISQQGWIGSFIGEDAETTLQLRRPLFYKIILVVFSAIMVFFIIFLNNIISVEEGFFEVSFGLLLGLWGTHEILIPDYIGSSSLIDIIIYLLYMFVIAEIVTIFIDEYFVNSRKRRIKIYNVVKGGLDEECVVLENQSWFPIDLTGWLLFDKAMNKFKFPIFVLDGKETVSIWTKVGTDNSNNLYWKRKKQVWNNNEDTIFLEDPKGDAIDNYSYD